MNGIFMGLMIGMGILGYFYYQDTQATIAELTALNAAYEVRDAEQKEAIEHLEKDFALQTEALTDLQNKSNEIQAEMNRYLDIFKRHDLNKLAHAKPGMVEKRVNRATKEVFDGIENDSKFIDDLDTLGVQSIQDTTKRSAGDNQTGGESDSSASNAKSAATE